MAEKERLSSLPEVRIGVGLPTALSARLDLLVKRADDAGARTSRKEVLAALILAATDDQDELAELVQRVRVATVDEAAVTGEPLAAVVRTTPSKPGPRPRKPPS